MAEVTSSTAIDGVLVVDPVVHDDDRGLFVETWRQEWLGNVPPMVQGNRADRVAGTGGQVEGELCGHGLHPDDRV